MKKYNLILPVAGKSSRFPNIRPKFLLTHPSGCFMLTESIRGLSPFSFDKILIISLQDYENKYQFSQGLKNELIEQFQLNNEVIEIILLDSPTSSQAETVINGIRLTSVSGKIMIKDCDNYFVLSPDINKDNNFIAVGNLHNETDINPGNKSYVLIGENGTVQNIVEKDVISNLFSAGAYFFTELKEFIDAYDKVKNIKGLFVSHIIYQMLIDGSIFFSEEIDDYVDWGTSSDWSKYTNGFGTIFIDIDGVLTYNSGKHFTPKWGETGALVQNVETLNKIFNRGKITIVLTTSRHESFRRKTIIQLKQLNIKYHLLVMSLPHGKRILINDYSNTNPHPSAIAINIKRDDDTLALLLNGYLNIEG